MDFSVISRSLLGLGLFAASGIFAAPAAQPKTAQVAPNAATASASASPSASSSVDGITRLDTTAIHSAYEEGEFDKVTAALEPVLSAKARMSREDSVFLYKHLGVIYSKNPASREKGKYCFRKLFDVDANAHILDMYATDDIYAVFRTVRDEWEVSRPAASRKPQVAGAGASSQDQVVSGRPIVVESHEAPKKTAPQQQNWKPWAAVGGAVAVTAGLTTWYLLSQPGEKKTEVVDVAP
jgi:hypothetical protein